MKPPLPTKTCPVCARPFAWRKKWERDWPNVIYCSKRCARAGRPEPPAAPTARLSAAPKNKQRPDIVGSPMEAERGGFEPPIQAKTRITV